MMAAPPPVLALPRGNSAVASYFTASFLACADLHTMREAALVSPPAREHVVIDWSCLASWADLVDALTVVYSTHRDIKVLYIAVPKLASEAGVAAAGFPTAGLRPATRFQNLVYDGRDVHWSVV